MAGAMRRARKRTAPDPGLPKKAGANILSVCQTWHRGTGRGEVRHRTPTPSAPLGARHARRTKNNRDPTGDRTHMTENQPRSQATESEGKRESRQNVRHAARPARWAAEPSPSPPTARRAACAPPRMGTGGWEKTREYTPARRARGQYRTRRRAGKIEPSDERREARASERASERAKVEEEGPQRRRRTMARAGCVQPDIDSTETSEARAMLVEASPCAAAEMRL